MKIHGMGVVVCLLAGCTGAGIGSGKTTCSDADGVGVVRQLLQEQASKGLRAEKAADGAALFANATIQAAVDSINIGMTNFRTTPDTSGSKRVACEATLTFSVPSERLAQTIEGLDAMDVTGLDRLADQNGYQHQANTLSTGVRYSLQPTDDGQAIFAELEQAGPHAGVLQQLAAGWLVQPLLRGPGNSASPSALAAQLEHQARSVAPADAEQAMAMLPDAHTAPVAQGPEAGGAGPSFDCAKASTVVEQRICQTPLLAELDDTLASSYSGLRKVAGDAVRGQLRSSQQAWLRQRNACGDDTACLKESYLQRIDAVCGADVPFEDHPGCIDTQAYRQ